MMNRLARSPGNQERRKWPTPSIVIAGVALFIALCSSAVAARGLIHSRDIAAGAVRSKELKNGGVKPIDLNKRLQQLLQGGAGANGATGLTGAAGANGANGPNGANGVDGTDGTNGTDGTDGRHQRNQWHHRAAVGDAGHNSPPHRQPADRRGRPAGSGRQLRRLGEDAGLPNRGRRQCRLLAEGKR